MENHHTMNEAHIMKQIQIIASEYETAKDKEAKIRQLWLMMELLFNARRAIRDLHPIEISFGMP